MEQIRSFLKVQRGEGKPLLLLFLYLMLALASFTIARAVRDSLFLDQYGAINLPYAYLAIAVVISAVVSLYVRLAARLSQATLITATLLFFILNLILFWWAAPRGWEALPALFYVWTSIYGIIVTAQVWTVAGMILDTRQARRLFPLLGSGGILGAFLGGVFAAVAVRSAGTHNLILLLLVFPVLGIAIVRLLSRRFCRNCRVCQRAQPAVDSLKGEQGLAPVARRILRSRYLRLIVGLLALSAVVTLLVDFQFKLAVQESIRSADRLTAFFGSFYAWVGLASFLLQILAGRWLVDRHGIRVALLILPIALLSGTLVLLAFPLRLWAALLLRGGDGILRHSIDKPALELLFVPIPQSARAEVKSAIDMVIPRLADGLGGLLLLLLTRGLQLGTRGTGLVNLGLLGLWLWMAVRIRREHVSTLRANLSERQIFPGHALQAAFLDRESTERVRAMLEERQEDVVLYAIELALAIGRRELIPAHLLRHPSPSIRSRALDVLPMTADDLERTLREEEDPRIRARILARGYSMRPASESPAAPDEHLRSGDIHMRLAAVTGLLHHTPPQDIQTARDYLRMAVGPLDDDSAEWVFVAEALGEIHHPAVVGLHMRLMAHPDRAVRRKAILSAGRAGQRELVPVLVRMLAARDSSSAARSALEEYGERILGTLGDIFTDPFEDMEIRRQIPLVLGRLPSQRTVDILTEALEEEDGLLGLRTIGALNRLRISGRDLRFEEKAVTSRIRAEGKRALRYEHALHELYPDPTGDLLEQLLREKIQQGRERVFRLLGLVLPPAAAHAAYRAILEKDSAMRANGIEYLDNALPAALRKWVLPLLESRKEAPDAPVSVILEEFCRSRDPVLRECAQDAVARRRWPGAAVAGAPA